MLSMHFHPRLHFFFSLNMWLNAIIVLRTVSMLDRKVLDNHSTQAWKCLSLFECLKNGQDFEYIWCIFIIPEHHLISKSNLSWGGGFLDSINAIIYVFVMIHFQTTWHVAFLWPLGSNLQKFWFSNGTWSKLHHEHLIRTHRSTIRLQIIYN